MQIKIPIWKNRRLKITIQVVKLVRLSEYQRKGYIGASYEAAGFEILTSKPDETTHERS